MVILTEKMKVGPKGQVVIPVSFRKRYNIFPGDEVMFEEKENGMMIAKPEIDVIALMRKSAAEIGHVGPIDSNKSHYEQIDKRLKRAGL
ncbi:MAG: AbrB/MazE/SpoVT family DNA-binding domain-containing protein [Nanoarchaeota archaeon]